MVPVPLRSVACSMAKRRGMARGVLEGVVYRFEMPAENGCNLMLGHGRSSS